MSIFAELRRRRLYRFSAIYIMAAWVILQVVSLAFDSWNIPSSSLRYIWLGAATAFPFAFAFAWRYDLTFKGIVRTSPSSVTDVVEFRLGSADYTILLAIVGAVTFIAYDMVHRIVDSPDLPGNVTEVATIPNRSVAVLPFSSLSTNSSDEYFASGLADTLLHKLAQLSGLRVIARNSSFQFKDGETSVQEIGNLLNVATVLVGSVQRDGDDIRVIAQLFDTSDGSNLFSQSFEERYEDVFTIQDRLADAITRELQIQVTAAERARLNDDGTESVQAYDYLMRGLEESKASDWLKLTTRTDGNIPSISLIKRAIDLDPDYAHAWAALSEEYSTLAFVSDLGAIRERNISLARQAAEEALRLDADLDLAHAALGSVERRVRNDSLAVQHFRRALELNPNNSFAASRLGLSLLKTDPRTSLDMLELAHEIDPAAEIVYRQKHRALLELGRDEDAMEQLMLGIQRHPDQGLFYADLSIIFFNRFGRIDQSSRWLSQHLSRQGSTILVGQFIAWDWLAVADEERLADWQSHLRSIREDSEWLTTLDVYAFLVHGQSESALARITHFADTASNRQTIVRLRAVTCIFTKELDCARDAAESWIDNTNTLIEQGSDSSDATFEPRLYQIMANRVDGDNMFDEHLEEMLSEIRTFPLTATISGRSRGYKEIGILSFLGRQVEAQEALLETLTIPDGGIIALDFLGLPAEKSPLLANLVGTPGYSAWLTGFLSRREAMRLRMRVLESQGEIIHPRDLRL